jgi:hypothetical protein
MTFIRRFTQLLAIVAVTTVGTLLVLEITDVTGNHWRDDVAAATRSTFAPGLDEWVLALLGLVAAAGAILLISAQMAPAPRGKSRMLEVGSNEDGSTHMTGRATLRAVEHELGTIEGVTGATATMPKPKSIHAVVRIDDRSNVSDIEERARALLDTPFWIDLGLPDIAVLITAEFDPRPPRVR